MIIFSHKSGQLCNRLFAFAHLIATAERNGLEVVNLSFDEYAQYFASTSQDIWCRYPLKSTKLKSDRLRSFLFLLNRQMVRVLRSFRWRRGWLHEITVADLPEYSFKEDRYFDLNNEIFVASLMTRPFVFLFGRFFRDYGAMDLYQPLIREYFKPTQSIQQKVENHISKTRRGRDLLIGVHIRRGDYASYVGGRYFYSFEQYRQVMHSLTVSSKNRRLAFLICSNEEVDLSEFNGLDVISAPGQFVEDLYCLSLCDYIVGPPSTFSKWASFYGETPLYHIYSINRDVDLSDFKMLSPEVLYNFAFN